jgi:hypothetical protein
MTQLVVLAEEPSACDLLEGLLPRILPASWNYKCIPFEGKQDLEKRGPRLVKAWQVPHARFVVVRDQDSADCVTLKQSLASKFAALPSRRPLVRIVCRELESWVLGDLPSFAEEFDVPAVLKHSGKAKYRSPDLLANPITELRHFVPGYQKRDGARRMGRRLDPSRNRSTSFGVFCEGVRKLTSGQQ